jgi:hypothetical protein
MSAKNRRQVHFFFSPENWCLTPFFSFDLVYQKLLVLQKQEDSGEFLKTTGATFSLE